MPVPHRVQKYLGLVYFVLWRHMGLLAIDDFSIHACDIGIVGYLYKRLKGIVVPLVFLIRIDDPVRRSGKEVPGSDKRKVPEGGVTRHVLVYTSDLYLQ